MQTQYTWEYSNGDYNVQATMHESEDPRLMWTPTIMACFHDKYRLGDWEFSHKLTISSENSEKFDSFHDMTKEEAEAALNTGFLREKRVIALPVYAYIHGGISVRTTPFSCRWDSGKVGIIFIAEKYARECWKWSKISKKRRQFVLEILDADVREYDNYLNKDYWVYEVFDKDGVWVDEGMCWGLAELKSKIKSKYPDPLQVLMNAVNGESKPKARKTKG